MSKAIAIEKAFEKGKAIMVLLTAGDPSIEDTGKFIIELDRAGVDLIEIGIPFSDPVAENADTQAANIRALEAGVNTDLIFDMISSVRDEITVPLVLKTYLNPAFYYGYENFCKKCSEAGISGLIIPDMPFEERDELAQVCEKFSITLISTAAPANKSRIAKLSKEAEGFIYLSAPALNTQAVIDEDRLESEQNSSDIQGTLSRIISCVKEEKQIPVVLCVCEGSLPVIAQAASKVDGVMLENFASSIIYEYKSEAGKALCEYVYELRKLME